MVLFELFRPPAIPVGSARPFELSLEDEVWNFGTEMAAQRLEKIESAPGNGMGSEAANLLDLVHGRD